MMRISVDVCVFVMAVFICEWLRGRAREWLCGRARAWLCERGSGCASVVVAVQADERGRGCASGRARAWLCKRTSEGMAVQADERGRGCASGRGSGCASGRGSGCASVGVAVRAWEWLINFNNFNTEHFHYIPDGFNPASVAGAAGNQGPPQMMGMGMSGRGGAMGPEGTPNMVAPNMMPENGAMQRNDRFPQGGPNQMGSSLMGGRPGVESPQQQQQAVGAGPGPMGVVGGPVGFGRGNPAGGSFDGPNNKRRRY